MRFFTFTLLILVFIISTVKAQKKHGYPVAPQDSTTDIYHGVEIADPYQWMENPSDPRLAEWLDKQAKFTKQQENQHTKEWKLRAQLATMYSQVKTSITEDYEGKDKNLLSKYEFKQKVTRYDRAADLIYRRRAGAGNYKMLVKVKDFMLHKEDNVVITSRTVDEKNDRVALAMSHSGSDWREIYFFDLNTGHQLTDTLRYLKGVNLTWTDDGVYYIGYDKPVEGKELLNKAVGATFYYHKLGTPQSSDVALFRNPDKTDTYNLRYDKLEDKFFFYHTLQSQGKTFNAMSHASVDNVNSFYLKNFLVYPLDDNIDFGIEAMYGDTLIINSNWNAPNGQVLGVDINGMNKLFEIVPQYDVVLRDINRIADDKFACIYRSGGDFLVLIFNTQGELLKKIDIPKGKKVNHFYARTEDKDYLEFSISSFYHPPLWYQLSLKDLSFKPIQSVSVPYDPDDLETRYVKYKSKDGTEIPMYITCLKNTVLDGTNPTLIYGYGGYGHTIDPMFDRSQGLWLLHGGILAIPNVRGGGAEGHDWGLSGRGMNKKNAIDDFVAAAEYLINEKYTSSEKLAIQGGSHGGMLVTAAMTQRPDLFKAVIAEAGVYDMLRFNQYTIGGVALNINEFGLPNSTESFNYLMSYSPLHNIKEGVKYPNVLLTTGDTDDRVPPLHSYKFLATLQEKGDPTSLYHLLVIPGAGHSGALNDVDWVRNELFIYSFLFDELGIDY